jgi:hypothetical protein
MLFCPSRSLVLTEMLFRATGQGREPWAWDPTCSFHVRFSFQGTREVTLRSLCRWTRFAPSIQAAHRQLPSATGPFRVTDSVRDGRFRSLSRGHFDSRSLLLFLPVSSFSFPLRRFSLTGFLLPAGLFGPRLLSDFFGGRLLLFLLPASFLLLRPVSAGPVFYQTLSGPVQSFLLPAFYFLPVSSGPVFYQTSSGAVYFVRSIFSSLVIHPRRGNRPNNEWRERGERTTQG